MATAGMRSAVITIIRHRSGFSPSAEAGPWGSRASDSSEIKSFDETPATLLHLTVRKIAAPSAIIGS
jgi:hypothetical protein